jgi:callose synthase
MFLVKNPNIPLIWYICFFLQVFSFNPKASVNFQMFLRLIQGIVFLMLILGLVAIVAFTPVTLGDLFASILALVPTGWGILSVSSSVFS